MNIFAATRAISFLTKLFAAASLNMQAMVDAGDENALKAHLEKAKATAPADPKAPTAAQLADIEAQVAKGSEENGKLSAEIVTLKAENAKLKDEAKIAASAASAPFVTGLAAAGIKVDATATADQITKATNARIEIRSGEKLGTHGVGTTFPPEEAAASPATAKSGEKKGLTGLARTEAAYAEKLKG